MTSKVIERLTKPQARQEKYELVVVFKPFLPDQVRSQSDKKIEELVTKQKGVITDKNVWGKRYLAYKIDGHNEGYYVLYQIDLPTANTSQIIKHMRRDTNALRYLLMKRNENVTTRHPDK